MAAYRIHADYDRNGRVSGKAAEWAARKAAPGALIRANLDADTRRLPAKVTAGGPVPPDREQQVKPAADNEPARIQVEEVAAAPGPLFLSLRGVDPTRIAVIDSSGHRISPVGAGNRARFALPAGPFPRELALEAVDLAASPPAAAPIAPAPGRATGGPPGDRVVVTLERDGPAGTVIEDEALFTLAPFVLIGNAGRVERLYMCAVTEDDPAKPLDDNAPSVADVRTILGQLGVPLELIPVEVHGGDTWIQDQYQLGFTETPDGALRVLLHAPRTRSDAARGGGGRNLGTVLSSHFLSQDLGVCQAFWDRELTITDPRGQTSRVTFTESDRLLTVMARVKVLRRQLFEAIGRIGTAAELAAARTAFGPAGADLWKARTELEPLLASLTSVIRLAPGRPGSPWQSQQRTLDQLLADAQKQVNTIKTDMPVATPPPQLRLRLPALGAAPSRDFVVTKNELERLERRLQNWHSSHNYGGNIEVGPPAPNAPAGVVVVGNQSVPQPDGSVATDMDPDLLAFLRGQSHGRQKVVEVDTGWLDVGHVDEMVAFVPDLRDPDNGRGAVLRASPKVALSLINAAKKEFRAGLAAHDRDLYEEPWHYSPIVSRLNNQGANPVTHLLRGLRWLHRHDPGQLVPTEPPEIYLALATAANSSPVGHDIPLPHSPWQPVPPVLPASISIFELFFFSDEVNDDLESLQPSGPQVGPDGEVIPAKGQLIEAEQKIVEAYGSMPIRRIPVFFDNRSRATGQTAAFTPDLANLQPVGNRLLIPRPHGPRMAAEPAARVLRAVAEELRDVEPSWFTPQKLRARGLDRTQHWARPGSVVGSGDDARRLATAFRDGWPQNTKIDIRQEIIRANPGAFDARGMLKGNGWRRLLIPERKVDLFEAWTEAVADLSGYRVHWVEAWYYHVRLGSIHCGTNVLRTVPGGPKWWR
jgi:protein-arginine deiminase (PAD)